MTLKGELTIEDIYDQKQILKNPSLLNTFERMGAETPRDNITTDLEEIEVVYTFQHIWGRRRLNANDYLINSIISANFN
jgi:hypothetical protein